MVFALAIGVVGATAEETNVSLVKNIAQGEIPKGITDLMSSQYGAKNYSKSKHCWKYHYHDTGISGMPEDLTYCIEPKKYVIQTINGKPLTFLLANSDSNSPEESSRNTPGMMGLFVLDENGKIISKNKVIMTGSSGYTGSYAAKFQQIGKQQYAWIFRNGVTYQGINISNYEIYAPINSHYPRIAIIDEQLEDDQTIRTLDFINDGSEHYPIQIYKIIDDKKEKYKKMIFDKKQNIYIDEK
ncbi:MAG: hypothetical protein AB7S65_07505 [Sulfuricurvum sp.]